jgi:hypothetical protein
MSEYFHFVIGISLRASLDGAAAWRWIEIATATMAQADCPGAQRPQHLLVFRGSRVKGPVRNYITEKVILKYQSDTN